MMMRWRSVVGVMVLGACFGSGCGGGREAQVTVAVGGAPAEVEYWERLAGDFSADTGIPVAVQRQPTDSNLRRQGLVVALKARQPDPDVFLMDVAWLAQFAASNWLEPLEDRVAESDLDLETFFPSVLRLADWYGDRLVALPVYVDAGLLYYRKDLLEAAGLDVPETWDQLVFAAKTVQERERESGQVGFHGFVWQGAQYEGLMCTFLEFAVSRGGGIERRDGVLSINTPENRAALQFMHDLIHTMGISPPSTFTEMKEEEVRTTFQRGRALFERNWPYAWALHQAEDSPVRGKVGIAPLPHAPGHQSAATLGGWHVGLSTHSDAKAKSWAFVRYVASYHTQKALALQLGWNPGRQDLYLDGDILTALPHFEQLREVFEHAYPRPMLPYYTQFSEVVQRYVNAALAGEMSAEEALAAAERDAQDIVKRYER